MPLHASAALATAGRQRTLSESSDASAQEISISPRSARLRQHKVGYDEGEGRGRGGGGDDDDGSFVSECLFEFDLVDQHARVVMKPWCFLETLHPSLSTVSRRIVFAYIILASVVALCLYAIVAKIIAAGK